jgi:hypothetical protein
MNEAAARVDQILGTGYIDQEKAEQVREEEPDFTANLLEFMISLRREGDLLQFSRLANLAVWLTPEGLSDVIVPVLQGGPEGAQQEDLVDILGQLRSDSSVPAIENLIEARKDREAPYFALTTKCIQALGEISSPQGDEVLRKVATGDYPKPLKWHAAVELGIEDDLGFVEDEMLQFP